MVDISLVFFLKNTILVSVLFWFLTFIGSLSTVRYEYKFREDFYECGFKSVSDFNFSLNFSFYISAIFLLLYDVELAFLIPMLFNFELMSWNSIISYIIFLTSIFITLIIDMWTDTVSWNY